MKSLILESAITFLVVIDPLALAAFFVAFVGKVKVEAQKSSDSFWIGPRVENHKDAIFIAKVIYY